MKINELIEICHINEAYLEDLVEYHVITINAPLEKVEFDLDQLARIQRAIRLQRDLEVNMAGAALILDLLDELNELRTHASILEKHLLK